MIVPDVNLLIYAHNDRAPEHLLARSWWENCLNGNVPIGLSWVAISGFLRLITHPRVLVNPMSVGEAIQRVREWLEQPPVRILQPGENFQALFLALLEQLGTGANLTTDAQLAALALENHAEIHTNDSDFSRFTNLRWKNPLQTKGA